MWTLYQLYPYHFDMGDDVDKALTRKVGEEIRRLRRAADFSQEKFADECGLHRTYMGAIERGEKTMTLETAKKVISALGLTLGQFLQQIGE